MYDDIKDGYGLPKRWRAFRRWLRRMPMLQFKAMPKFYVEKFGYVRNGDVYEIDGKCVGLICMVVILSMSDLPKRVVCEATGLTQKRIDTILRNYKYYVGWHNVYTPDGRIIYPPIREVQNIHTDFSKDVIE